MKIFVTQKEIFLSLLVLLIWVPLLIAKKYTELSITQSLFLTLIGEALLLIPVLLIAIRKKKLSLKYLGFKKFNITYLFTGLAFWVLILIFNVIYAYILSLFNITPQADLTGVFKELGKPLSWILIISASTLAPFFEEIYFRAYLLRIFENRYSKKIAIISASAVFAIAHLYPASLLPIFLLGILFSYLFYKSNSIWPGVIIHCLNNFLAFIATYIVAVS